MFQCIPHFNFAKELSLARQNDLVLLQDVFHYFFIKQGNFYDPVPNY